MERGLWKPQGVGPGLEDSRCAADGQVPRHLPASLQQTLCPLTHAQGPTASPLCHVGLGSYPTVGPCSGGTPPCPLPLTLRCSL